MAPSAFSVIFYLIQRKSLVGPFCSVKFTRKEIEFTYLWSPRLPRVDIKRLLAVTRINVARVKSPQTEFADGDMTHRGQQRWMRETGVEDRVLVDQVSQPVGSCFFVDFYPGVFALRFDDLVNATSLGRHVLLSDRVVNPQKAVAIK